MGMAYAVCTRKKEGRRRTGNVLVRPPNTIAADYPRQRPPTPNTASPHTAHQVNQFPFDSKIQSIPPPPSYEMATSGALTPSNYPTQGPPVPVYPPPTQYSAAPVQPQPPSQPPPPSGADPSQSRSLSYPPTHPTSQSEPPAYSQLRTHSYPVSHLQAHVTTGTQLRSCRQLGFSSEGARSFSRAFFGQGTGPILLDDVYCVGTESRLADCTNSGIGNQNCGHYEDAGVRCIPGIL